MMALPSLNSCHSGVILPTALKTQKAVRFSGVSRAEVNDRQAHFNKRFIAYNLNIIQKTGILLAGAIAWLMPFPRLRQRLEGLYLFPPIWPSFRFQLKSPRLMLAVQDVTFTTSDKVRLHGWYLPPQSNKPTLVYSLPVGAALRSSRATFHLMHKEGYGLLVYEYRGNGHSNGKKVSESGFYKDLEAASHYLVTKRKTPIEQQILVGESLGSGVTTHVAQNKPYKAVVLISPYTSLPETFIEQRKKLGVPDWLFPGLDQSLTYKFDSINKISNVRSPVLIVHGTDDWLTPLSMGERLYESATGATKRELLIINKGNHNHLIKVAPDAVIRALNQL